MQAERAQQRSLAVIDVEKQMEQQKVLLAL
jgi:hypothetical protein